MGYEMLGTAMIRPRREYGLLCCNGDLTPLHLAW